MEISIKSISHIAAIFLTGLSAGLFYAWSVSVIPGTRRVLDPAYLETMQSINRAILNPAFFAIFFGSLILLAFNTLWQYQAQTSFTFWIMLAATLIYLIGTFGVTAFGNVPLNNMLEAIDLSELNAEKLTEFRHYYESRWNRLHTIRTIFSVLSFLLSLVAIKTL